MFSSLLGLFKKSETKADTPHKWDDKRYNFSVLFRDGEVNYIEHTVEELEKYILDNKERLVEVSKGSVTLYRDDKHQLNNIDKAVREQGLTKVLQRIVNKDTFLL